MNPRSRGIPQGIPGYPRVRRVPQRPQGDPGVPGGPGGTPGYPEVLQGTPEYPGVPRGTLVYPFVILFLNQCVSLRTPCEFELFLSPQTARVQLPARRLFSMSGFQCFLQREVRKKCQQNFTPGICQAEIHKI